MIEFNTLALHKNELQQEGHTATKNVYILSNEFPVPQLQTAKRIWVYLPPDYYTGTKSYGVLYMNDGQNIFDSYTASFGEWCVDEYLDSLAQAEVIVIGIDHGENKRLLEYNPYNSVHGEGRGDDYVDFVAHNLKPYIDKHFRTKKGAACTAIAGGSMGGLIALYAAVKYPEVFGKAGVFSPAFWIAPDLFSYVKQTSLSRSSGFYFVCGDSESEQMVPDMEKMVSLIAEKNLQPYHLQLEIIAGAGHEEKQWQEDFPRFYQWLVALC